MKLSKLIEDIPDIRIENFKETEITSVTADSKHVSHTAIFVAIEGARCDGHDYIWDAYRSGVRVFVVSKEIEQLDNIILIISKNTKKTLAELCAKICGNPERRLILVGITGTKGKTTTSYILSRMLDFCGVKNILIGTLGVIGEVIRPTKNTTPDPTVLFPVLRDALRVGVKVAILEVSSQALKNYRIYGMGFDYIAFTGLSKDHIGEFEHPTHSDYINSKRRLFTSYGAKNAVVNYDDAYSSYISSGVPNIIRCGFSPSSNYRITEFENIKNGSIFRISAIPVNSALSGEYNARNAALATALAHEICRKSVTELVAVLSELSVPGRFEVYNVFGRNVIVDYAHNYDSVREVTLLASKLYGGKIICVFGSVGERSYERRSELALAAERFSDFSVITSDNPFKEFPLKVCSDIYACFNDKTKAKIITKRSEAILYAMSVSKSGDTVMLLGRGHENGIDIDGKYIPFSDSDFVRKLDKSNLKYYN